LSPSSTCSGRQKGFCRDAPSHRPNPGVRQLRPKGYARIAARSHCLWLCAPRLASMPPIFRRSGGGRSNGRQANSLEEVPRLALSAGRREHRTIAGVLGRSNALIFHYFRCSPLACSEPLLQQANVGAGSLEPQALQWRRPEIIAPRWPCSKRRG